MATSRRRRRDGRGGDRPGTGAAHTCRAARAPAAPRRAPAARDAARRKVEELLKLRPGPGLVCGPGPHVSSRLVSVWDFIQQDRKVSGSISPGAPARALPA